MQLDTTEDGAVASGSNKTVYTYAKCGDLKTLLPGGHVLPCALCCLEVMVKKLCKYGCLHSDAVLDDQTSDKVRLRATSISPVSMHAL